MNDKCYTVEEREGRFFVVSQAGTAKQAKQYDTREEAEETADALNDLLRLCRGARRR